MILRVLLYALIGNVLLASCKIEEGSNAQGKTGGKQEVLGYGIDGERYKTACPDYKHYAVVPQYVIMPYVVRSTRKMLRYIQPTPE